MQGLRGSIGRSARLLGALVVALGLVVAGALPAAASTSWRFTRYDVEVVLDATGAARVTVDLTFDLAGGGHGPLLTLVTQQAWDSEHDRTYTYDDIAVTSPTAPDTLDVQAGGREIELRIGDPHVTVRGEHDYTLTYTVRGLVNGASSTRDGDQLYWNVLTDVSVPVENLAVTVRAPGPVTDVVCHAGRTGQRGGCATQTARGSTATYTAERLPRGGAMTVVAVTDAGTLGDPAPLLVPATASGAALRPLLGLGPGETLSFADRGLSAFALDGLGTRIATTALGGSVLAGALLLVRRGRDRFAPAPVAPGAAVLASAVRTPSAATSGFSSTVVGAGPGATTAPSSTDSASYVPAQGTLAPALAHGSVTGTYVPDGAQRRPDGGIDPLPYPAAEVGVLVDGRADSRDLLAAVLDLARHGYVQLEATGAKPRSPLMVRTLTGPDDGLSPFDRAVLDGACPAVGQAFELDLTLDRLASRSTRLRAELDADVTARGWFVQAPGRRRSRWWSAGRRLQRLAWWGTALVVVAQLVRGTELLEGAVWWGAGLWVAGGVVRLMSRLAVGVTAQGAAARREVARYRRDLRALRRDPQRAGASRLDEHLPVLVALGDEQVATRAAHAVAAAGIAVVTPRWADGWDDSDRFYRDLPRRTRRMRRDLEAEQRRSARAASGSSGGGRTHGSSGGSGRSSSSSSGSGTGGGGAGGW